MTKTVNSLTASSEMGGPMTAMYLLGHPDHYTSHKFRLCFWRSFVNEVMAAWPNSRPEVVDAGKDKVMLRNVHGQVKSLSPVDDYVRRPVEYSHMSLYDWLRLHNKVPIPKKRTTKKNAKKGMKLVDSQQVAVDSGDSDFENDYTIDKSMADFIVQDGEVHYEESLGPRWLRWQSHQSKQPGSAFCSFRSWVRIPQRYPHPFIVPPPLSNPSLHS